MASSLMAAQASSAYVDEDYQQALELYGKAIAASPDNAKLYVERAQTHIKLENFLEATEDAGKAIALQPGMAKAHLRKGVALFNLDELESARCALQEAQCQGAGDDAQKWLQKVESALAAEGGDDATSHVARHSNGVEAEAKEQPSTASQPALDAQQAAQSQPSSAGTGSTSDSRRPLAPAAPQPFSSKYRHQWYQMPGVVELGVLAKGLTPDRVDVCIREQRLEVTIRTPEGQQEFELKLDLHDKVVPEQSGYELLKSKLEVRLQKANPGLQWQALERKSCPPAAAVAAPAAPEPAQRPAYPSSFTRKHVDWNKLEHEIAEDEKNEKLEGDAALNKLFRDIYSRSDEDTRRAMNKSFQESNGTVLSTNWKDIGAKKTDWQPPEGSEVKKFEQ